MLPPALTGGLHAMRPLTPRTITGRRSPQCSRKSAMYLQRQQEEETEGLSTPTNTAATVRRHAIACSMHVSNFTKTSFRGCAFAGTSCAGDHERRSRNSLLEVSMTRLQAVGVGAEQHLVLNCQTRYAEGHYRRVQAAILRRGCCACSRRRRRLSMCLCLCHYLLGRPWLRPRHYPRGRSRLRLSACPCCCCWLWLCLRPRSSRSRC